VVAAAVEAEAKTAKSFVDGLFGTFKWVITAIIGFYFAAGAASSVTQAVQEGKTKRKVEDRKIAEAPKRGNKP
jgi:hypothetical protein